MLFYFINEMLFFSAQYFKKLREHTMEKNNKLFLKGFSAYIKDVIRLSATESFIESSAAWSLRNF